MKKQFIAIILTIAMLVAMVPVMALPAAAVELKSTTKHTVPFASPSIEIDGECDEAYEIYNSEPIKSGYIYKDSKYTGEVDLCFDAYSIATMDGIYLWIDIQNEKTQYANNNNKGDYLQFYVNMGQITTSGTYLPYVLMDYNNKPTFSGTPGSKTATVPREDGWMAEIFIPWTPGTPAAAAVAEGRTDFFFSWCIQVNDDRDNNGSRDLIAFDSKDSAGLSCYRYCEYMSEVFFTDDYKVLEDESAGGNSGSTSFNGTYGAIYTEQAPVLDGELDYLYAKGSKLVDTAGSKATGEQFEAYVIVTKQGYYVWAKINDNTQYSTNANSGDYLQIYYNMGATPDDCTAYGYVQCDYTGAVKVRESKTYDAASWPSASTAGIKTKIVKTTDYWIAEIFQPWRTDSAAGKAMLAGEYEDTYFGLGIQVNNDTDGDKNRDIYCYDSGNGGSYWVASKDGFGYAKLPKIGFIYDNGIPSVPVYEKITFDKTLVLGKALQGAKMKYTLTMGGEVIDSFDAEGIAVDEGKYSFRYDIAPEYMGAALTAELILDDYVFATLLKNYSVVAYYNELLASDATDLGLSKNQHLALQKYIYNTLNYGAAAQKYVTSLNKGVSFTNDQLVNKDTELFADSFKGINNYEEISATKALEGYGAELISMGINYNDANRIYVKFRAENIDGITVTFGDNTPGIADELTIYAVAGEEDTYIAYSPLIAPDNYALQYTIRLVYDNSVIIQKAICSVDAYLAETIANENSSFEMVELAKATYLYGKAARSYMAS